jgi:hypothetical protein
MRPYPTQPRILTEAEPLPAEVTDEIAEQAITTYEHLTRPGHPAGEAMWPPVEDHDALDRAAGRATAAFEQTASGRDWTVPTARVRGLAADAIGLYVEGVAYDYDRERAHAAAVLECLQGEAARAEVYQPPPDIEAPATPAPTVRVQRTRERGER